MSTQKRKYELKARAERQRETRERIVQATADLHEEVGPARTTVAEIARRAGVQRLTVYNHFPTEGDLFPACKAHWEAHNPFPDLDPAFALDQPPERVRAVLRSLYAWYRATRRMTANIHRDRGTVPAVDALMKQTVDIQMAELASALAAGFGARGRRAERLRALLGLALDFWTWRRLDREGLDDSAAANLMTEAIAAVAG
jgi:AcrR family transcriptional regulator